MRGATFRFAKWYVSQRLYRMVPSCLERVQEDRDVDVIKIEENNTVKSLRDKLQALTVAGNEDGGFPIVREDEGGLRLVGYIGASELEHALSTSCLCV